MFNDLVKYVNGSLFLSRGPNQSVFAEGRSGLWFLQRTPYTMEGGGPSNKASALRMESNP